MKKIAYILSGLTIFMAGCASTPGSKLSVEDQEKCLDNHSKALCLLDFVGRADGASDVTKAKVIEELQKNGANSKGASSNFQPDNAFLAVNTLDTIHTTSTVGFGTALPSAVFMFALMSDSRSIGQVEQFFIALPESKVKNNNPYETMKNAFVDGFKKSLNADKFNIEQKGNGLYYKFFGGMCGETGCTTTIPFVDNVSFAKKPLVAKMSPSWMNSEKTYIWTGIYYAIARLNGRVIFNNLNYPKLMGNLPSWFYYYKPGEIPVVYNNEGVFIMAK